jgi:N-acetylneuraminate synthase
MKTAATEISIEGKKIGLRHPTYFIADLASNHDGSLEKAKELIYLAKEAGADVAKFQHFHASSLVSDKGFRSLGGRQSHQANWKKSVYDTYLDASMNPDWTQILKETCDKAGITFFTSPYSELHVNQVDPYVPAYKIGSGDITWPELIQLICKKGKPVLLACGASTQSEVDIAVKTALSITSEVVLMQCNTNYTASIENFKYINLNVLKTFSERFPGMILGLSDHTTGCSTVLGAVVLGARVIEKHFTDDNNRSGPDHRFAMNPKTWREMVDRTRELESALGNGIKVIEENEKETVIVQRRGIYVKRDLRAGEVLKREDLECLRPCPNGAIPPFEIEKLLGMPLLKDVTPAQALAWSDVVPQK